MPLTNGCPEGMMVHVTVSIPHDERFVATLQSFLRSGKEIDSFLLASVRRSSKRNCFQTTSLDGDFLIKLSCVRCNVLTGPSESEPERLCHMTLLSTIITHPWISPQTNLFNPLERPIPDLFVNLAKGAQTTKMDSKTPSL